MICFRCYDLARRTTTLNDRLGPRERRRAVVADPRDLSLRDWILHFVVHGELQGPLLEIGFLDAEGDGGLLFWRWDFWNAWTRTELRRQRRLARGRWTTEEAGSIEWG